MQLVRAGLGWVEFNGQLIRAQPITDQFHNPVGNANLKANPPNTFTSHFRPVFLWISKQNPKPTKCISLEVGKSSEQHKTSLSYERNKQIMNENSTHSTHSKITLQTKWKDHSFKKKKKKWVNEEVSPITNWNGEVIKQ